MLHTLENATCNALENLQQGVQRSRNRTYLDIENFDLKRATTIATGLQLNCCTED